MGLRLVATVCACTVPLAAEATNGLNLIGFGPESVAMGGADTAVARDTTALNTNPSARDADAAAGGNRGSPCDRGVRLA